MKYIKYIFFACLFLSIVDIHGIIIVEPSVKELNKAYRTVSELKRFFKKHGMKYLEHNVFNYKPILKQDMKKQSYYLEHSAQSDSLIQKYQDHVRNGHRAPIELHWVNNLVGYGVFAYKPIKKDDFIAIYTGEVDLKENIHDTDYCWAYPAISDDGKSLSCDSKFKGNEMRYVNHSYRSNVIMKNILVDNVWNICYIATQDIPAGKQLLVNYGSRYWRTRSVKCQAL